MALQFHKMHGAGNDFVMLDLREQEFAVDAAMARTLADRRTGIGCDQLLVLRPPSQDHCLVDFEVWNADGSRAEQCGNGVRCIGLYLSNSGEAAGAFRIRGPVSVISLQQTSNGWFRVNMGAPRFEAENVPVNLELTDGLLELQAAGQPLTLGVVSMGNPHAVMEVADISAVDVDTIGAEISRHPAFPQGCNAGFAEIIDRKNIRLRVFERGAGETMACGSGACAAVSSLANRGKLDEEVLVNQVGGSLIIEWTRRNEPVMMTGPAVHLFEGTLT